MASLSSKLFSPYLFPRGRPREPRPAQLAGSKLPPPAAEIDERPMARVRRFKLWSEQVGDLRVTLLDPTRRDAINMRDNETRYRTFVVPSPPQPECRLSPSHRSFQIDPQPLRLPPLHSPPSTLSPETLINPKKTKIPKKERERTHERLLEHRWILDQEHERRFRRGMAAIMTDVLEFQKANTQEFFRAIRKDSTAIYAYLDPLEISLVANRDEVHRMVKEEERKRRKREKKKANKELEKEAEARLNEERERLETEREAEASLNRMEGLRRTIDESQITPDSFHYTLSAFAKTCTQEQYDKVARHIANLP
ncbi:hypothetical protein I305_00537 [Cryptococcus gattii E566]|uniref:Uncharacterized protein n=2 Tax=Cryptococcus gattii TaxID=37769 RepID=E6R2H4_CRYGW|nr:Hypothetical Protein CGB_C9660C [Cryptococcus gattii WM276]ADV21389.1 Hypothetical Protein CGB_C9660C [Cryptococcus gattii WM276]KIR81664.1 hypothetical protein I306_01252 [Cryptococcus gattii EJB2]KIY36489.1 hypothetical protein I305_00537 [Cryptococcus gattii E566]